jgi:hypothetical protein
VGECRETPCDPLNPLEVLNWAHLGDGRNLLWVGFDALLRDNGTKQHAPRNSKNAFLGLSLTLFARSLAKV